MESVPPLASICSKFPARVVEKNDTEKLSNESLDDTTSNCKDCQLPLIDLSHLYHNDYRYIECKRRIADAAKEWGFFQIINHGIPRDVLVRMQSEQRKLFDKPFEEKANEKILSSSSSSCYRWGNSTAKSMHEFSWSEAFQLPLCDISSLRSSGLEEFTEPVSKIAQRISEILAESLDCESTFFFENSSYVRLNRYPPCPNFPQAYGLVPHTDSDILTVLHQDQLGGLQLFKNGEWINVNPNQDALIINVGDLFEAWSNGVYKSIKHRVVTNPVAERQSIAYFLCPTHETVIQSYCKPSLYRNFSFGEYRKQIQEDVKSTGTKIGLPRFLK